MKGLSLDKMYNSMIFLLAMVSILFFTGKADAATFCVNTAADLQSALMQVASNTEADIVRILQGTYNGNFFYSDAHTPGEVNLTIECGYLPGCGARVVDPTNTILDAGSSGSVLVMSAPSAPNWL